MSQKKITNKTNKNASEIVDAVVSAPPVDKKARDVRTQYKDKAIAESANLTIDKVTESLTKAGLDISKTLNSVRELFESKISSLQTIQEAIEAKQEELEELYGKEVVAASLTDIVLKHEAEKANLFKEQEEVRNNWNKEMTAHSLYIKERNDSLNKERIRENEEFEYTRNISRRNSEDAWRTTYNKRLQELSSLEESKTKEWALREELIAKTEAEVAASKSKLDNFDAAVKAEVDRQVAIASNAIKSKYETDSKIKALEFDNQKNILEKDNSSLRSLLESREKDNLALRAALEKKDSEVKEVAVAALNSQSGMKALAAVQEAVQNQSGKK